MKVPSRIWHGTFQIFLPWFGDSGWKNRPKQTRPPGKKVQKLRRTNKRTHNATERDATRHRHDTDMTPTRHDTTRHDATHKETSKQANKQTSKQTNKQSINQLKSIKSNQLKSNQIKSTQINQLPLNRKKKKNGIFFWQVTKCSIACAHAVAASPTGAMMGLPLPIPPAWRRKRVSTCEPGGSCGQKWRYCF